MTNPISIVGKWQGTGDDGFSVAFNFDSDGVVQWSGNSSGKTFQCKGIYHLDETVRPAVLQVADVEILQIDAKGDPIPVIEEGMVMRFYQEFDGASLMRMQGMPVETGNESAPADLRSGPNTMTYTRQ